MLQVSCHGLTDQGRKRQNNQDQFLVASLLKSMKVDHTSIPADQQARFLSNMDGHLLLVADGMGGHAGGEVASQIAIDAASEYVLNTIPWFYRLSSHSDDDFQDELKSALQYCNNRLLSARRADPERQTMATTLTMAYFAARRLYVVHAGDSRCYLIRGGEIHQLTRDHSIAQAYVDAGKMDAVEAASSPMSHMLYNSIGGSQEGSFSPDVCKVELRSGDTVLLCTDGLTRHVADEWLLEVVEGEGTIEEKNRRLVQMANEGGGSDNITVVQAEFFAETSDVVADTMDSDKTEPMRPK